MSEDTPSPADQFATALADAMLTPPEYDVVEYRNAAGKVIVAHRTCLHAPAHVVPVETGGEVVAHLCTDCDAQLPEWWTP